MIFFLYVYCEISVLGSNEFFLNSIPEQLYGECLSTYFFKQVFVNYYNLITVFSTVCFFYSF